MELFITPMKPMSPIETASQIGEVQNPSKAPFQGVLENAIKGMEQTSAIATQDNYSLMLGDVDDLAQLQINSMKAQAMLQTTVQLTTRMVNAYKEIMQMQI